MSRNKNEKRKHTAKKGDLTCVFDLDLKIGKYFYLILPLLFIIYYIYANNSAGFYGDDEIFNLMNLKYSFENLGNFIGVSTKPGYKLIFFLPSLFGETIYKISHILLTCFSVLSVYILGKDLKIKNSSLLALIFGFQPFIILFSFRAWPEILTGFIITWVIILFKREKYILSALFASYTFSIRQEYGVIVSIILGIYFLYKFISLAKNSNKYENEKVSKKEFRTPFVKYILPLLLLGCFPLLIAIIGFIYTGRPFFILENIKNYAVDRASSVNDFWHYFRMYIFIIGPVLFILFISGFVYYLKNIKNILRNNPEINLIYLIFCSSFILFVLMGWEALNFGGGTGALRFLLPISPLASIIGGVGLGCILDKKYKVLIISSLLVIAILVLLFLSWDYDKTNLINEPEYLKFTIIFIIVCTVFYHYQSGLNHWIIIFILSVTGMVYPLVKEKPLELSSDYKRVIEISKFWKKNLSNSELTLCNHIYFYYLNDIEYGRNTKYSNFNQTILKTAPLGTICIWDCHYSYRPEYNADVNFNFLINNPDFKLLHIVMNTEGVNYGAIFKKIRNYYDSSEIKNFWRNIDSFLLESGLKSRMIYCNNTYYLFSNEEKENKDKIIIDFDESSLQSSAVGSIFIYQPKGYYVKEMKLSFTPMESVKNNTNFKLIRNIINKRDSSQVFIYEKIKS